MDLPVKHMNNKKSKVEKKKVDDKEQWVTKVMDIIKNKKGKKS